MGFSAPRHPPDGTRSSWTAESPRDWLASTTSTGCLAPFRGRQGTVYGIPERRVGEPPAGPRGRRRASHPGGSGPDRPVRVRVHQGPFPAAPGAALAGCLALAHAYGVWHDELSPARLTESPHDRRIPVVPSASAPPSPLLEGLNPVQAEAVLHTEGPVLTV